MEVTLLKRLQGCPHACTFLGCGRTENINYIVMQIQGPNLSELRRAQGDQKFSASTALRLVYEALQCIEAVHSEGFLHRDVKPSNFAIGCTKETSRKVYILDFGLARQYLDGDDHLRPERSFVGFRGTTRYASLNAHRGKELGRHDDLVSLFYMTVEFLTGKLPWRKVKEKDRVAQMKKQFIPSRLLQDDYAELEKIFYYLNGLRYHQKPDYDFVRRMLCRCIVNKGVHFEDSFDWEDSTSKGISCSSEGRGESVRKIRGSKHKNRFDANAPYIGLHHEGDEISSEEWAPV
ncbi:probable serine/threonine-protein kinase DDB_G0292354 isoform X2 [Varroa jacobsoni]|nr:probable serine/threonine-protein kinase DDB_G0292354 isoform X2 [Varroa destructor]XP_022666877.1 probable serine/threonine-protein kinase DDB_G0292354 isoform X2 [Varroa destructor]XP_022707850.1 probable serine/threonine-protein kinase DDB_G0292354 isoform X2 [Varroa jacobsoni]XP_022707851.1 probable serine/threonine-protein kinase DDB_G0292354 isoform X2 [Varroa jacobsoni]